MDTITLILPGVVATKSQQRIQSALHGLEGVQRSNVDLARSWATITFDPDRVSAWNIVVAIEQTGYHVGALVPAASQHLVTEPSDKRRAATPAPATSDQHLSAS